MTFVDAIGQAIFIDLLIPVAVAFALARMVKERFVSIIVFVLVAFVGNVFAQNLTARIISGQ